MTRRPNIAFGAWRAALASAALIIGFGGAAQAQWFGYGPYYGGPGYRAYGWAPRYYTPPVVMDDELTPDEIVDTLRERGFRNVSRPAVSGDSAVVRATDPAGRAVRLTLDIYTGRIIDRQLQPRPQVAQRSPDQGATIRSTAPDPAERTRATPERPTVIRREPLLPPQSTTPGPPAGRVAQPPKPAEPARPPEASVGTGTRTQPRRIDITPPAELDAPAAPQPKPPSGPPINSVPPASLE